MKRKTCYKCGEEKDLSAFYKHKGMIDGHLGKCILCAKKYSIEINKEYRKNVDWVENEKTRSREKYFRLGYSGKYKPNKENKQKIMIKWKNKFPEKVIAKNLSGNIKKIDKNNQNHHWSYRKEHVKDVVEMNLIEHCKLHRYIVYDQERMMYRRTDTNELLDTKELHLEYYNSLKNKN